MRKPKVAVIGAGLAGITLANQLADDFVVTVFEKSSNVSGRMATRYHDQFQFDHGAQFFTAKSAAFQQFLQPLIEQQLVVRWDPQFVEIDHNQVSHIRQWDAHYPHYVAVPKMTALTKFLSAEVTVQLGVTVARVLAQSPDSWAVVDHAGKEHGVYDWVVAATPAAQAHNLMPPVFAHHETLRSVEMLPCFSLMLGFAQPLTLSWQAACVTDSILSWISANHSKPGRPEQSAWVVLASNHWSQQYFDHDRQWVQQTMLDHFEQIAGELVMDPAHIDLQRWRYANASKMVGPESYVDPQHRLAAIGDWCIQGRVENAYLSAIHCSERILAQ